jgi:hypothetical protein
MQQLNQRLINCIGNNHIITLVLFHKNTVRLTFFSPLVYRTKVIIIE